MKKKFLTLQTKLMFVILFVIISSIVIFLVFYYLGNLRETSMLNEIISTDKIMIQNTIQDHIQQQENLAKDYSTWDDMYQAVQSKNIDWIKKNTYSLAQTYQKEYFAVYDIKGNCLYYQSKDKNLLNPDIIKKLKGNYGNFFILNDSIPVKVSWSIITTSIDTARKLQGIGYFIIGNNWDSEFMKYLSQRTGSKIFIHKSSIEDNSSTITDYNLTDIDGQVIADVHFQKKDFVSQIEKTRELMLVIALISMIVTLLIFWYIIRRHVTHPIRIILKSLKTGNTNILEIIKSNKVDDEWDLIVDLIKDNVLKTKQLKEMVSTKDQFFGIIAHDLKSPFNSIIGFADLLVNEGREFSEVEKKKILKNILQASQNAYNLLEQLLEWARLQTGRWIPNPQSFKINKLIEGVVSFHNPNAIQKEVNLISNIKESFNVYADEKMIEIVIRNLISNAIKFTQIGGLVTISLVKENDYIEVTISDNGKGMNPELVNSLFKIGENVVSSDISGKKGTGLGLILCKDLVEKNGGKIWVESELEKGSKFHFTIPLTSQGYTEPPIK